MSAATRTPPARVRPLRALSLVLAFAAAVGLVFGTAGFTAMEADRGLAVNVTDDESAYLGYEPVTDTVSDGTSTEIVEYRNQFGSDLDEFDVDVSSPHEGVTVESVPETLDRGDAVRVVLTVRCDSETTVPLGFDAHGTGDGVSVSLDRTHSVTCVPREPTVTGVRYTGVGNAFVEVNGRDATVEAIVWLTDAAPAASGSDGPLRSETVANLDASGSVRPQLPSNASNERIAAVEFPDQGVAFFHPGWNGATHVDPQEGHGVRLVEVPLDAETVSNASAVGAEPDD